MTLRFHAPTGEYVSDAPRNTNEYSRDMERRASMPGTSLDDKRERLALIQEDLPICSGWTIFLLVLSIGLTAGIPIVGVVIWFVLLFNVISNVSKRNARRQERDRLYHSIERATSGNG